MLTVMTANAEAFVLYTILVSAGGAAAVHCCPSDRVHASHSCTC